MESLTLTKYVQSDFNIYYSLVKEDNVMRYISGDGLSEEQAKNKFHSIIAVNAKNTAIGYFKVFNVAEDFIGDCKLEWTKEDDAVLEIGYILKEEFWGQGYGTMICAQLLTLADTLYPHTDIIGIIDPDNVASKKLLEKYGFESYFIGIEDDLPTEKLILNKKLR